MLEAPGEEAGAGDPHRLPVHVTPSTTAWSKRGVPASRPGSERQPSGPRTVIPSASTSLRVDEVAEMADVLVVGAVVDEHPQRDADLVGGEPDALRRVHRGEHVLDQPGERGPEVGDVLAGGVEHRVAEQAHGADESGTAGDGAVSHGRKGTFHDDLRVLRRCRGAGAVAGHR